MAFPVSVIQTTVEPGEADANRRHVLELIAAAVSKGARLIVFPEACISDIYRGAEKLAESIPGPSTDAVAAAAADAVVALPLLERAGDGGVYSSCAFVARDGIKGVARKCHLYRDASGHDSFRDEEVMQAGRELSIVDLGEARAGVLIGFDAEFPEAFRTLALRGADFILAVLNQIGPDLAYLGAMAARNRVPLLAANRIGFRRVYPGVPEFSAMAMPLVQDKDGSFLARCRGASVICDAGGHVLAEPSHAVQRDLERLAGAPQAALIPLAHFQQDEILSASFRIDEIRVQRLTSPYLAQRRPELYSGIAPSTAMPGTPAAAMPPAPVLESAPPAPDVVRSKPSAKAKPKSNAKAPRKRKTE